MKMLDRSIIAALRPTQERAKLFQTSRELQLADAETVMSDNDVIARREQLEDVEDLDKRWTALRDDCAAMLNRWDADASDLGRAEENVREMLQTMQDAIRLSYAREYFP